MSRPGWTRVLRRMFCAAVTLGAIALAAAGCGVEVGAEYPTGVYDGCSDAYVATTDPVYYDGRPAYWCGGYWQYREGGRWRRYEREPRELGERRMRAPSPRRVYEPSRGRPAGPAGGGRGGGRPAGGRPPGHR